MISVGIYHIYCMMRSASNLSAALGRAFGQAMEFPLLAMAVLATLLQLNALSPTAEPVVRGSEAATSRTVELLLGNRKSLQSERQEQAGKVLGVPDYAASLDTQQHPVWSKALTVFLLAFAWQTLLTPGAVAFGRVHAC